MTDLHAFLVIEHPLDGMVARVSDNPLFLALALADYQ
jgi:hypothetical protein